MCTWAKAALITLLWGTTATAMASVVVPEGVEALGRSATDAEVIAWDIDVRPDFLGLPPGSGDVWQGEETWLAQCAS